MKGLTTNAGTNYMAVFMMGMTAATAMDDGLEKTILMIVCMVGITVALIFTKGYVPPDVSDKPIEEVVEEGRNGDQ